MLGRNEAGINERRALMIFHIEDPYFRKHFRMTKSVFERLVNVVGLQRVANGTLQRNRTDVQESTLVGLWMLFNRDTFRSAGLNFDMDMSVAHYHYKLLLGALCEVGGRYIKWPSAYERTRISDYYERNFGLPGVVAVIDGTLVNITASKEQKQRYVDKNHNYSINVMIVSDHRRLVRDTYVGQPGSVNDARVFRRSPLAKCLYGRDDLLSPDEYLVGDGGYVNSSKLIVPYKNDGHLTPSHRNFNFVLSQCRATVERLNSLWKERMGRLRRLYCKSVTTTVHHIAATLVLHNFILLEGHEIDGIVVEGDVPNIMSTRQYLIPDVQVKIEEIF